MTDRVTTVLIDNPPLNILDLDEMSRLTEVVAGIDPEATQVVVVRGAGDRAFSAGVSIDDHVAEKIEPALAGFHALVRSIRDLPCVTVAVVDGHCLGGGLELASACDLVLASDRARFGLPEIKLACYPPVAAALYPRLAGSPRAMDLVLTGRSFDADEALSSGLVSRVVSADDLEAELGEVVTALLATSGAALRLAKRAVRIGEDHPDDFDRALELTESLYLDELVATDDMTEGITAFLEKRTPTWRHR